MKTRKTPRAKGRSDILPAQTLSDALRTTGVEIDVVLVRGGARTFFSAEFWPPTPAVRHERLYVVVGDVPSEAAAKARMLIVERILPECAAWVGALQRLPGNSTVRMRKQQFACDAHGAIWRSNLP